ncbi:MAG: hypothetical protein PHC51_03800 [bacterium]|nr:hypothetical protein [bacterium]
MGNSKVPESGFVVVCADNERVCLVVERARAQGLLQGKVVFYGCSDLADYRIASRAVDPATGLQKVCFSMLISAGPTSVGTASSRDGFETVLLGMNGNILPADIQIVVVYRRARALRPPSCVDVIVDV